MDNDVKAGETCERFTSDVPGITAKCGKPAVVKVAGLALCEEDRERLRDWGV